MAETSVYKGPQVRHSFVELSALESWILDILSCNPKESGAFLQILPTKGRVVGLFLLGEIKTCRTYRPILTWLGQSKLPQDKTSSCRWTMLMVSSVASRCEIGSGMYN